MGNTPPWPQGFLGSPKEEGWAAIGPGWNFPPMRTKLGSELCQTSRPVNGMNTLLEKAFAEAATRPEDEQALIASIVLDELRDEALWQQKFARDGAKLDAIAERVQGQIARGETQPYDPSDAPQE